MNEIVGQVIDAIKEIPAAVWSAIGTALVSFVTMRLTNGHSARQLATQLQHDSSEKAAERRATLRRDVYLPAAEAIVKLNGRMGALPQADLENGSSHTELSEFSAAMTKLQLVGEPRTAELATEVLSGYGTAFMQCLPRAAQIQRERAYAATQDELYKYAQVQVKRVLAEMTALNETGAPDRATFERLQISFNFFSKQASERSIAREKHQTTANALHLQYLRDTVETMKGLSAKFVPLLVAVRHELGLAGELGQFRQMLERQTAQIEQAAGEFIRNTSAMTTSYPSSDSAGSRTAE